MLKNPSELQGLLKSESSVMGLYIIKTGSPYARIVLICAGSRCLIIPVQLYEAQMRIGQLDWVGVGKRQSQEQLANDAMLCRYRRTLRIFFFFH